MVQSEVVLYTTTNCRRCELAKRFLGHVGVPYREVSLFRVSGAVEELVRLTGALAAPVLVVGNRFVRGYDPDKMTALLADEVERKKGPSEE